MRRQILLVTSLLDSSAEIQRCVFLAVLVTWQRHHPLTSFLPSVLYTVGAFNPINHHLFIATVFTYAIQSSLDLVGEQATDSVSNISNARRSVRAKHVRDVIHVASLRACAYGWHRRTLSIF